MTKKQDLASQDSIMEHLLFSNLDILRFYAELPPLSEGLPGKKLSRDVAFITGATGFIGGFLLKVLIEEGTFQKVICLVRGTNEKQAKQRLKEGLLKKGLSETLFYQADITVVSGNVLLPFLGLRRSVYEQLSAEIDHVFHFAAAMNLVIPFTQEAIANIDALKNTLIFCAERKLKMLHYASSMGIWTLLNPRPGPIYEDEIHNQGDELPGGYFQSKWVNEMILKKAMGAGFPINIYRIGDVKGNSENGLGNPQNFGNHIMRYCIKRGVLIDSDVPEFNFIPVDYLAKAIVYLAVNEMGQTFQFSNPDLISFKDIYYVARDLGHECKLISYQEWVALLSMETDALGKVLNPVFRQFRPNPLLPPTSFYAIGMKVFQKPHDVSNTRLALKDTSIICPGMLKDQILERYLAHLGETVQP